MSDSRNILSRDVDQVVSISKLNRTEVFEQDVLEVKHVLEEPASPGGDVQQVGQCRSNDALDWIVAVEV